MNSNLESHIKPLNRTELLECLTKEDESIRLNAALDLAKAGIPDGIPILVKALGRENYAVRIRWAAKALETLGDLAIPTLKEATSGEDPRVRPNAAALLYRIDNQALDIVIKTLSECIEIEDGQVQFDTARAIDEIGRPAKSVAPILVERLHDYNWCSGINYCGWYGRAHSWSASALASMGEPIEPTLSVLMQGLRCPEKTNEWFAWASARALRTIGTHAHATVPALTEILLDDGNSARLRVQVAYTLASVGLDRQNIIQTLMSTLEDKDDWVRLGTLRALSKIYDANRLANEFINKSVMPAVIISLNDESHHVRRTAALILARFGESSAGAIPALADALGTEDTGGAAAEALVKIGSQSTTVLKDLISSSDKTTRRFALYAMSKTGKPALRKILGGGDTLDACPLNSDFYHPAPIFSLNQQNSRDFENLYRETISQKTDHVITVDYNLPFPKHEFLTYLAEQKNLIMHGSAQSEIQILKPLRQGFETEEDQDTSGIYAAPDGILPIYYAVCDIRRITGQNSGYFTGTDDSGKKRRFYFLSVGVDSLREEPWTIGNVYILPRNTFIGGQGPNWTSRVPVRPLAKLPVSRKDLPFDIWGMGWTHTSKIFLNTEDDFPFLDAIDIYPIRPIQFK